MSIAWLSSFKRLELLRNIFYYTKVEALSTCVLQILSLIKDSILCPVSQRFVYCCFLVARCFWIFITSMSYKLSSLLCMLGYKLLTICFLTSFSLPFIHAIPFYLNKVSNSFMWSLLYLKNVIWLSDNSSTNILLSFLTLKSLTKLPVK